MNKNIKSRLVILTEEYEEISNMEGDVPNDKKEYLRDISMDESSLKNNPQNLELSDQLINDLIAKMNQLDELIKSKKESGMTTPEKLL